MVISAGDFFIRWNMVAGAISMPFFGFRKLFSFSIRSTVRWSASQPMFLPTPVTEATARHMLSRVQSV